MEATIGWATRDERGGALVGDVVAGGDNGRVPQVDLAAAPAAHHALHRAIRAGQVRACHDLSEGGLGVAAAEMAFAGGLGMRLELPAAAGLDDVALLWSESPTRWLVEVAPGAAADFAATLAGVPCAAVGELTAAPELVIVGTQGDELIRADVGALKQAWQRTN